MDTPHPASTPRRALPRQASLRLALGLCLCLVLVASATALVHQALLAQAGADRAERLSLFYQTRVAQWERDWAQHAGDLRAHLVQAGAWRRTPNGKRVLELEALLRPPGHSQPYARLWVLDEAGRPLFHLGADAPAPPAELATWAQPQGWWRDAGGPLYRVRMETVPLDNGEPGRLLVLFPLDADCLAEMSLPDTSLTVLHRDQPVARSSPLSPATQESAPWIQRLSLPWDGPTSPVRLDVESRGRPLFGTWELTLGVSVLALAEGLILWSVLGPWLLRQARRLRGLEAAARAFQEAGGAGPGLWERLADAIGADNDEIRSVAVAFTALAERSLTIQAELKRALGMFQATVEGAPVAMLLIDRDGRLRMANGAAGRLFGLSHAALLATPVEKLLPEPLRTRHERFRMDYLTAPSTRPLNRTGQFRARRADGGELDVEIGLTPIETADGVLVLASLMDISGYKRAEAVIAAALEEKTQLLNEVHHRVKNNLQVIASLLSLQASQVQDPIYRQLLAESEHRVQTMALVHHLLYERQEFARVNLGDYLHRLAQLLRRLHGADGGHVQLRVEAQDLWLELSRAIPCGLIVNELLTNCFKHAFDGQPGEIRLTLSLEDPDTLLLVVADNGRGLPDLKNTRNSLGMQIIEALSQQMGARLRRENRGGAHVELRFAREPEPGEDTGRAAPFGLNAGPGESTA